MTRHRLPDTAAVMRHLKGFQRDTVDYVCRRFYEDAEPTDRFLIADEVGLGKTLVARGVIARAIDHLRGKVKRIDIVYICSNADIARQNIARLQVSRGHEFTQATRLTMMAVELGKLRRNPINYVSFTPATSFDHKTNLGMWRERVVLYLMLRKAWGIRSRGARRLLAGNVVPRAFQRAVEDAKHSAEFQIDDGIARRFRQDLKRHDAVCERKGKQRLRDRFAALASEMDGRLRKPNDDERRRRNEIVGELRGVLAATCVRALQPDLIILDEFQRFKHLLNPEHEAGQLANELFTYGGPGRRAKVLLLSATPYKMYTLGREAGTDDHYRDFLDTLRFLVPKGESQGELESVLEKFRAGLLRLGQDVGNVHELRVLKQQLEARLRSVMARTERLSVTVDRDGMLARIPPPRMELRPRDLHDYLAVQRVARTIGHPETIEYWKSAPYLLNFMDEYKLKRDFHNRVRRKAPEIAAALSGTRSGLLGTREIRRYEKLDLANARLRWLVEDALDSGAWRLLWVPPALPYTRLAGPFAEPALRTFTKRLVFSSWRVAPRAAAALLSYEVERETMKAWNPEARNGAEDRKRLRGLLRFTRSDNRLTGLPVLALLYPCSTLADLADPMEFAASRAGDGQPALDDGLAWAEARIAERLQPLGAMARDGADEDERWYWAAPLLMDRAGYGASIREWWAREDLALTWSGSGEDEEDETTSWQAHLDEARAVLASTVRLGRQPRDLARTLAYVAFAAPGVTALRALGRADRATEERGHALRDGAARVAWAFRSLFNQPESMALLRGLDASEPYWLRVLEYSAAGCIQATLDEYVHVLRDAQSTATARRTVGIERLVEEMVTALGLRTSLIRPDGITVHGSQVTLKPLALRCHYALRYGDERQEDGERPMRASQVRSAFNSPFRPFVLISTSVGQEGLDFHPYCHAVVHWNLPSNPVDLEQREGRVHRYKGHAVRRNVAMRHGAVLARSPHGDLWKQMFDAAEAERASESNDLVPYWIYPVEGGARIERHVPALPLSRESARIEDLLRSLAVYRMVFGQPRQEDLLSYLRAHVPEAELEAYAAELRIDLSPPAKRT